MTVPSGFGPLSCSLKRPRASRKMSSFARKYSLGYRHMICVERTKSTSEKSLMEKMISDVRSNAPTGKVFAELLGKNIVDTFY